MDHRSWVKEMREAGATWGLCALVLIGIALFWSTIAAAEPGRGRPGPPAEPKRSYAAIDVVMYQTSW